jgi:hypothetical protein
MNWAFLLSIAPAALVVVAWALVARSERRLNKVALSALCTASIIAVWALALYFKMRMHPEYAKLPPWQDPVNLEAGLLMFGAPVPVILGLVAAFKKAPWWLVALVELISLPLMLVGCASAASV